MKASTVDEVKREFREVKGEANKKSRKATNDPTLEGKDENKVGRVQRKTGHTEKARAPSGLRVLSQGYKTMWTNGTKHLSP